jgi:hypothetical protein
MTPDLNNARWRKSSRSGGNGGQCVEVALLDGAIAVRDSKNPAGPALVFAGGHEVAKLIGNEQLD